MRNISFAMTTPQVRAGTKDITRRLGWKFLKEDDQLMAVEKCQGLKKGEKVKYIRQIRVKSVYREPLNHINKLDVIREGFPDLSVQQFVMMFCRANKCEPSTIVTRIEFCYET